MKLNIPHKLAMNVCSHQCQYNSDYYRNSFFDLQQFSGILNQGTEIGGETIVKVKSCEEKTQQ